MKTAIYFLAFCGIAAAQFENGFVKILKDQRYQEGALFGNRREQEDGIKYHEETDANNIRRGYWEYPSEDGTILRTEFEAGPGIGFRITSSNHLAPTPFNGPVQPVLPAEPKTVKVVPKAPVIPPIPVVRATTTTTTPGPLQNFQNLFDYPANLEFSRHQGGHRFKISAA